MNKIILLITLIGFNAYAQRPIEHTYSMNPMFIQQLQNQKIESLQNQVDKEIENLQNQVDKAINHQALRKAVLDRQENSIDWWLSVLGIVLMFFTMAVPIVMWLFKSKVDKDISQIEEIKQEVEKIKQKAEKIKQKAEQHLDDIRVMKDDTIDTINAQKNAGHPEDAKTIIKKAKEQGTELDKLIANAFELQNQNSIEKAIDKWREILQQTYQINNQNLQAFCYFNLGYLYDDNNKFYLAVEFYQKTIEIKPDYHDAYYNMGVVYAELGEHQQALEAYQKAIEIKSDNHEAYNNMGIVYNKLGEHQQALEAYQKAIEIKSDNHEAYNNMGIVYNKLGEHQQALEAYQKAIEIKSDNHKAYYNMGAVYDELGEHQQALEAYQKAIEIKPDDHEVYGNMGIVYDELGKHQQALKSFQKAIEIKLDYYGAYYNMGNVYDAVKNFDKAIDNYNTAIKINPSIGKEIEPEDWKILTHRIKTLNNPTIKQQYQDIFNQLKGGQNKK